MNMSLATQKKKQKKNILQNYNKMETNKSVYCEGYSIDPIHVYVYSVDYYLEKAMNLPITYTYLLICLLPPPPPPPSLPWIVGE